MQLTRSRSAKVAVNAAITRDISSLLLLEQFKYTEESCSTSTDNDDMMGVGNLRERSSFSILGKCGNEDEGNLGDNGG